MRWSHDYDFTSELRSLRRPWFLRGPSRIRYWRFVIDRGRKDGQGIVTCIVLLTVSVNAATNFLAQDRLRALNRSRGLAALAFIAFVPISSGSETLCDFRIHLGQRCALQRWCTFQRRTRRQDVDARSDSVLKHARNGIISWVSTFPWLSLLTVANRRRRSNWRLALSPTAVSTSNIVTGPRSAHSPLRCSPASPSN